MSNSKPVQDFNKYMLAEYQNIAEAHFKTIDTISSFFRYYLIIMALPITLFSAFVGLYSNNGQNIYFPLPLLSLFSIIISLIGFCMLLYVINLRMDAILYARTVNAIRKYFYDESGLDIDTKLRIRVLPQTTSQPRYFEKGYFIPVVSCFAIFNSLYFLIGMLLSVIPMNEITSLVDWNAIYLFVKNIPSFNVFLMGILFIFFLCLHFLSYFDYSSHREYSYLRSYIMGVDIDGVLNKHRHHFCDLLQKNANISLHPDKITTIPLHDDPALGVSRDNEKQVFNDTRYWTDMPDLDDASYNIRRLKNVFKLKIHIFTHRQWPSEEILNSCDDYKKWKDAAIEILGQRYLSPNPSYVSRIFWYFRKEYVKTRMEMSFWIFGINPIDIITKCWLQLHSIEYDNIVVEKGSEDVPDPRGEYRNRFTISRKKSIRFFVEDDHQKATKLAYICDVVFLINHPYNEYVILPKNVIRVKSWNDIYQWIKKLS